MARFWFASHHFFNTYTDVDIPLRALAVILVVPHRTDTFIQPVVNRRYQAKDLRPGSQVHGEYQRWGRIFEIQSHHK